MKGRIKKYWDGKDKTTIIKSESIICDCCKNEYNDFVTEIASLPPTGIYIDKNIFICDKCISEYFWNNNTLQNVLFYFENKGRETFYKELFDNVKIFLPYIFNLCRKSISKNLKDQIF